MNGVMWSDVDGGFFGRLVVVTVDLRRRTGGGDWWWLWYEKERCLEERDG